MTVVKNNPYFILKRPLFAIKMTVISRILSSGHFERYKVTVNRGNS